MVIEIPNDLHAGVGDRVEVSLPEGVLLRVSALIYLLPIIALLAGAFFGGLAGKALQINSPLTSIIGGVILMALAFYGVIIFDRTRKSGTAYHPRMTRILSRVTGN